MEKPSCAVASASGSRVTSAVLRPEGGAPPGTKSAPEGEEPVTAADLRALKAELLRLIDEKIEQLEATFREGTSEPMPRVDGTAEAITKKREGVPAALAG